MPALSTTDALRSLAGPQAQAGWETLVERHGPDVWRLILSRSRDVHEAEDAYQDFWMRLPRIATAFTPAGGDQERSARAWVMRVAYTTAIDRVRRRRPVTVQAQGAAMESASSTARLVAQDHIRPGTEDLADRDYLVAQVQTALKDLPENYRRPILLYVVGGLSYEELAADLRCTVNNARVRVHRGLKRLREVLGGDARLNERALAGLILPVMFAMPAAPPLAMALEAGAVIASAGGGAVASTGSAGGVAGSSAVSVGVIAGAGGAVVVGVGLTVALAQDPGPVPAAPPPPAPVVRVLDDFDRADVGLSGTSHPGVAPELSLAPAPEGGSGRALRFGWNGAHRGWIDCTYEPGRRTAITTLRADGSAIARMRVWAPATTRLRHLGLRFADARGEIFEWRQPLPDSGRTGWRTVEFVLDEAIAATWDRDPAANRLVDLPLKPWGYAVALGNEASSTGVVLIDQVEITEPAGAP